MLKDWCGFGVYAAETISLATQTGVIRSVDSLSTVFLTALVNIELNSLLPKPLMTSDKIFTWLHSSCVEATTMSWKLRNLISYESLQFASDGTLIQAFYYLNMWCGSRFCTWWKHVPDSQQYKVTTFWFFLRSVWRRRSGSYSVGTRAGLVNREVTHFTRYSSVLRTAHASSFFSSLCLEK